MGQPGMTLEEIRATLRERGIVVRALSIVAGMLPWLGLSHERRLRAIEQERPDVARAAVALARPPT